MFKICDEYRLVLSILASVAGIAATVIFPMVLGPDILYAINKFFKSPNLGDKPARKSPALWATFYISLAIAVTLGSMIAVSPVKTCTDVSITWLLCDPPGKDSEGEYVIIQNTGTKKVNLEAWTLCDAQDHHCYVFPQMSLTPGGEIKLWTKVGQDTGTDLYWGETVSIWNNGGDTARLRNAQDQTISELSCSK